MRQAVERFSSYEELARFNCTVEEREEYEPYIEQGLVVFAGVDYRAILARAESEADILLWDGGNNDFSFLRPDVGIVVVDALRPGQEVNYYPGETNFRQASILVINKIGGVPESTRQQLRMRIRELNPSAQVIEADLEISADAPQLIQGRHVLVVEDGPTLTHGGMDSGAGMIAAEHFGALEVVDPRPHAAGSIRAVYEQFPHLGPVVPALGYSPEQCRDLEQTINNSGADVVIDASPCGLERVLHLQLQAVRVRYTFHQVAGVPLLDLVCSSIEALQS
jgi:predicted GTPase